ICLRKKSPITNCVAIPGRPPSLYSGAISPSMNSQSILPASCTSSCLMLMIWSSRARNRSPDPVVSCFFGRIAPSDAATESCFSIRGNRENEFASFQGLRHGKLAISSQQSRQKTTLAQWVRNSSRATDYRRVLTRRSKSTASLPSPMLTNCTQTELDATGRRSRLGTWPTRNGLMPAGQVGELWSDFYVCQTTADVDCDQRGDVGDRETVASDKLVPA